MLSWTDRRTEERNERTNERTNELMPNTPDVGFSNFKAAILNMPKELKEHLLRMKNQVGTLNREMKTIKKKSIK